MSNHADTTTPTTSLPLRSPTSNQGSSETPPITANAIAGPSKGGKVSRACTSCNRQKLKCDGMKPCARCITIRETCAYLPSMRGKIRKKRKIHTEEDEPSEAGRNSEVSDGNGLYGLQAAQGPLEDYQRWERNRMMPEYGPRNSWLWRGGSGEPASQKYGRRTSLRQHSNEDESVWNTPGSISNTTDFRDKSTLIADKLTTLPLPGDRNPLAVLAEASASATSRKRGGVDETPSPLIATGAYRPAQSSVVDGEEGGDQYYAPLPRTLKDEAPHIMNLISVHEAENLFDLYFTHLHPHLPLLDTTHSSPAEVARRNNFLFNAICCVSARSHNIVLWNRLAQFAKYEAERLPKEKNIDVIQGHLIYCHWNLNRPKHFELDMTWLRSGLAVRTGLDVNLHRVGLMRQAKEGLPGWVIRAIARTWLGAYIVDQTMSAQLGKPATMRSEKSIKLYIDLLRNPINYPSSNDQHAGRISPSRDDLWIAALAEWTQILTRSIESFRSQLESDDFGLLADTKRDSTTDLDFPDLTHVFRRQFRHWRQKAVQMMEIAHCEEQAGIQIPKKRSISHIDPNDQVESGPSLVLANIRLYEQYAHLVICTLSLERAVEYSPVDLPSAIAELQKAATSLIDTALGNFEKGSMKTGAPDPVFHFITFAAVSLLRPLQITSELVEFDHDRCLQVARQAADLLGRAAVTPDHMPAGQSVFLNRLIQVKMDQHYARSSSARERDNSVENGRSKTPIITSHGNRMNDEQDVDQMIGPAFMTFEAFGQILDRDQGRSVWPPVSTLLDSSHTAQRNGHYTGMPQTEETLDDKSPNLGLNSASTAYCAGQTRSFDPVGNHSSNDQSIQQNQTGTLPSSASIPTDLRSWVASTPMYFGNSYTFGINPGGLNDDGDVHFGQEEFWRNLMGSR